MTFEIIGKRGEEVTKKILPYVHRWTALYRRGILAKLYQLETFLGTEGWGYDDNPYYFSAW